MLNGDPARLARHGDVFSGQPCVHEVFDMSWSSRAECSP